MQLAITHISIARFSGGLLNIMSYDSHRKTSASSKSVHQVRDDLIDERGSGSRASAQQVPERMSFAPKLTVYRPGSWSGSRRHELWGDDVPLTDLLTWSRQHGVPVFELFATGEHV